MKIAKDLFFYPWESFTQNNANSIMITGEVKALIDPGHKHLFPELVSKMRADGFGPEDMDMVILTHCHPDHMEAALEVSKFGAKIALHPDDGEYLAKIGPSLFQALGMEMPEINIDVGLVEGELNLGGKTFEVYHTPGHSPGEVCLYWPEHKVLIAGDLVFSQGVGRTDFPGGSGKLLKESIRRMSELDIEILLPGHGPEIIGREKVRRNFQMIEQMYFAII